MRSGRLGRAVVTWVVRIGLAALLVGMAVKLGLTGLVVK
jgi:hypothetical protein